jgi:hypothetical protein
MQLQSLSLHCVHFLIWHTRAACICRVVSRTLTIVCLCARRSSDFLRARQRSKGGGCPWAAEAPHPKLPLEGTPRRRSAIFHASRANRRRGGESCHSAVFTTRGEGEGSRAATGQQTINNGRKRHSIWTRPGNGDRSVWKAGEGWPPATLTGTPHTALVELKSIWTCSTRTRSTTRAGGGTSWHGIHSYGRLARDTCANVHGRHTITAKLSRHRWHGCVRTPWRWRS